jgi:cation transport ATPase
MNPTHEDLRERLLNAEHVTPSLKQRYEQEIQAMLERKLTGAARWVWFVTAIASLVFAVWFLTLAVTLPRAFPWPGRLGFVMGSLFSAGWATLGFRVFRRRSLNMKIDTGVATALSWGLPVALVTMFMVGAPNDVIGLRMIVSGLVFLVMGAVFLLRHLIEQSELKTHEKLLEIEYRLAEFAEAAKRGELPSAPPQA